MGSLSKWTSSHVAAIERGHCYGNCSLECSEVPYLVANLHNELLNSGWDGS